MGMKGTKGGAGNIDPTAGLYNPFPIGPRGGRTAGKVGMPFGRIQPVLPSLQQQYSSLNQGVQGFQPLGIRGYTPPLFAQPFGGFNPFGFNTFGGNPFFQAMSTLGGISPTSTVTQTTNPVNTIPDNIQAIIDAQEPNINMMEGVQRQEPIYQTQVVEGGADIRVPVQATQNIPTAQTAPLQTIDPINITQQSLPMSTSPVVGKAGGGRVQGFAEGGMPEQNQTADRLEEETIMALMGKHPNPKEVFMRYMEVYGENGLMQLATEVEEMMSTDGRMIDGPGGGVDDFVPAIIDNMQPAALSKDEYVIPADVVAHAGDGSSEAGGREFDRLVARVRKAKTGNTTQPEQIEFEEEIQKIT